MNIKLTLTRKAWLVVSSMLALELVFLGVLGKMLFDAEQQINEERHVRKVISHLTKTSHLAQLTGLGLFRAVTLRESSEFMLYDTEFNPQSSEVFRELKLLKRMLKGRPEERKPVLALEATCNQSNKILDRVVERFRAGRKNNPEWSTAEERIKLIGLSKDLSNQINLITDRYKHKLAAAEEKQYETRALLVVCLLGGVVINVVLALLMVQSFVAGVTRRIDVISDNSLRLASDMPLNPLQGGDDEIADLDHVFHEVAETLQQAINKERAVIQTARDVICSIDEEDRFVAVNPAALSLWGYTPEDLIGQRFIEILVVQDRERTREAFANIIRGLEEAPLENRIIAKDGRLVDMHWSCRWSDKEMLLFCVARDITEQKQAERERREIARMKQDFTNMVSHDLKTPLASIKMTLGMFAEGIYDLKSEKGQNRVKATMGATDRLINLVNDLLDLEKLDSGQMDLDMERCDLSTIAEYAEESVLDFARGRQVSIETDLQPACTIGDSERLVQVLVNLLSNAIKFSPEESVVRLSVVEESDWCEVRVEDQGCGIPEDQQSRVFERFKQVKDRESNRQGTGLGLAICKAIVEGHKGDLGVESKAGEGSTFWIKLPKLEQR